MTKIVTGSAVKILSVEEGLRLDLKDENDGLSDRGGEGIPGVRGRVRESLLSFLFSFGCWYGKDAQVSV